MTTYLYFTEAARLARALAEQSQEELRAYCETQAGQLAKVLFDRGAYTAGGAEPEDSQLARPAPGMVIDVLSGLLSSKHINGMVTFYHEAQQGDVDEALGRAAAWHGQVGASLLTGQDVPPCIYCGDDHSPTPGAS
jgi:hypothetical protein